MSTFFIERFPHQSLNLRRFRSEQNGAAPVNVGGEELRGLVTALFFADSAHKSRKFTRQLRKFYDKVNANNPRLEVVFVPPRCDKDDGEEMAFGEEHGNWLYLAHRRRRNEDGEAEENGRTEHSPPQQLAVPCLSDDCPACKLLYCYKLNEAPYLTLIRPNGDVLYTGAVDDVLECFDRPRCCLRRGRMSGRKAERTVDLWCWLMQHNNQQQQQQNNFDADWVVP